MSAAAVSVLIGTYATTAVILLGLSLVAKQTDRVVFAVYPPWLSSSDIAERIRAAGGRQLATSLAPYVAEVVLPDRSIFARVAHSGVIVMLSATSARLCSTGSMVHP